MKSLSANFLCCSCKLYQLGLVIGFTYFIPNLLIVISIFGGNYDNYTLAFMCFLTVISSLLLIRGLIEERYTFLLPWLANITVLILFNVIFVIVQFKELNRLETKESFYMEFGFFIALELQLFCWYIIYCLLMKGYEKNKRLMGSIGAISKIVEAEDKDYYKINLIANEHLINENKIMKV